jgi:hypothetical protein
MGEWGWVIVGYIAMLGALGAYTMWLRFRLVRLRGRVEDGG